MTGGASLCNVRLRFSDYLESLNIWVVFVNSEEPATVGNILSTVPVQRDIPLANNLTLFKYER